MDTNTDQNSTCTDPILRLDVKQYRKNAAIADLDSFKNRRVNYCKNVLGFEDDLAQEWARVAVEAYLSEQES
jgi:hypothetical protein